MTFTSAETGMVKFVLAAWHVNVLPKSSRVRLLYTILFKITPVRVTSSDESKSDPDCHHVTFGKGSPTKVNESHIHSRGNMIY